jgi:hypothetical protein
MIDFPTREAMFDAVGDHVVARLGREGAIVYLASLPAWITVSDECGPGQQAGGRLRPALPAFRASGPIRPTTRRKR